MRRFPFLCKTLALCKTCVAYTHNMYYNEWQRYTARKRKYITEWGKRMFLTTQKLWARTKELERRRYAPVMDLFPLTIARKGDTGEALQVDYPGKIEGEALQRDEYFIGWNAYANIQKTAALPAHKDGFTLWGLFDFGRTGGGYNSGFESLLFVDGERYQAVDTNHKDVPLDAFAGQNIELTFLLWTGLNGGHSHAEHHHRFACADICYRHEDSDALYRYARGICEAINVLPETDSARDDLIKALDAAFRVINWDEESLFETASAALAILRERLDKLQKRSDITVYCAGHTHIDVAWLWRLKHTHEKTVRSFTTALRLMDEYEDFVFLQSQPQLLSFVKKDAPALYARIKEKVAAKQWEPEGGMWLEADCNISSGESLARQLLHGCHFLRDEFGRESEYLWLPDVFGYSWALPQLLKLANIKTFMTTKISWNQYDKMPHDLFNWRGIDGSEILTYFITAGNPGQPDSRYQTTYNALITADVIAGAWRRFSDKGLSRDVLVSYGYGDGGGGVTREMIDNARVLNELPGLPNVKLAGGAAFFQKLHENVKNAESHIPVWDGELYLEYHRGTYTTQARNKKWNRLLENRLARAEWLDAAAVLRGGKNHHSIIHDGWECVLLHQFHDIIPGSSVQEVYDDSMVNYQIVADSLDVAESEIASVLAQAKDGYALENFASYAQNACVLLPEVQEGAFTDGDGKTLPAQRVDGGTLVQLPIGALGSASVGFAAGKAAEAESPFIYDAAAKVLETPHYKLKWNQAGRLASVLDLDLQREVLSGEGNALELYEDKPLEHDAWDIDMFYAEKMELLCAVAAPKLVEAGALRAVLRFTYTTGKSTVTQDVTVYAVSRRIDFVTAVDWHEDHRLLKAAFPFDVRATKARYDIQFGYVERPTHWNTSWDQARFEVVGHKWADISEHQFGVAILNDCKYGYSAKDSTMRLTLLKSSKEPDGTADMGAHSFTYSLLPHANDLAAVMTEAAALNLPPHIMAGGTVDTRRVVCLSGGNVQLDACKRAEDGDGFVLRIHEAMGGKTRTKLSSDFGIKRFAPCNLLEDVIGETVNAAEIPVSLKPFEIKCFRVWF